MLIPQLTYGPTVVRLRAVTQELSVGVGRATASVRTLSDVSIEVGAGELIVLAGARGAGERAVLAVMAGDRRGVTGMCEVLEGTRVRLLRIGVRAAGMLADEWQHAAARAVDGGYGATVYPLASRLENAKTASPHGHSASRELFLLDVQADAEGAGSTDAIPGTARPATSRAETGASGGGYDRELMYHWAAACQRRGCAVVMAAGHTFGEGLLDVALQRADLRGVDLRPEVRRASVHEASRTVPRSAPRATPAVRIVAMHCGRVAPPVALRRESAWSGSRPTRW